MNEIVNNTNQPTLNKIVVYQSTEIQDDEIRLSKYICDLYNIGIGDFVIIWRLPSPARILCKRLRIKEIEAGERSYIGVGTLIEIGAEFNGDVIAIIDYCHASDKKKLERWSHVL